MPCLAAVFALITPRFVIIVMALSTDYLARAYESVVWPVLGFIFVPTTTLAYAWAENTRGEVAGVYLIVVVLAVLFDLGVIGGGRSWFIRARR